MEYFTSINNVEAGPYSEGQLESMIKSGHVTLGHLVRKGNTNNWVKITEIPELKIFFDKPAQSVPSVVQAVKEERRLRHGFTSFVLWLFRIGSWLATLGAGFDILCQLGFFAELTVFGSEGGFLAGLYPLSSSFNLWLIRIIVFFTPLPIEQLFKWKRSGFWLYVFLSAASAIFNPIKEEIVGSLIFAVISIGILYGILQIHNAYNAKTTWEQLV
jgi:hypothetical protein